MRNLLGAVLFVATAVFLAHAWALRRRVLAGVGATELARRRAAALADPRSLSAFGEIARPLVLVGLGWLALKSTLVFVMLDGERVLSWFDLAGFLALLAGYGVWFSARAAYWVPEEVPSPVTAPGHAGETDAEPAVPVAGPAATAMPVSPALAPQCGGAEGRSSRRAA